MISQYEIPTLIAGKLPQIESELSAKNAEPTVYHSIQVLTDYTKRMALEHNFKMLKNCMSLVQTIYERGNQSVRNAVENVFIFSFSTMLSRCNTVEWKIVQSYMPSELYSIYVEQVLKSRC
jgi:hypothetical protein